MTKLIISGLCLLSLCLAAHADEPDDQASDLLRNIKKASAPILAEMAEKHGYGLEDDQLVRVVRPPFDDIRMKYYQTGSPGQAKAIPRGPDAMSFRWKDGKLSNWGMTFGNGGGYSVSDVLCTLQGFARREIEGDGELLGTDVSGDWIVREGCSNTEFLEQIEQLLRVEYELPIRLKYEDVEREVWVASDEYKFAPLPGQPARSETQLTDRKLVSDPVQIFRKEFNTDGSGGGGSGNLAEFLQHLGDAIGDQVVDSAFERPEISISWRYHDDMRGNPDEVLKNITAQTGLTFGREVKLVKRLLVTREKLVEAPE